MADTRTAFSGSKYREWFELMMMMITDDEDKNQKVTTGNQGRKGS